MIHAIQIKRKFKFNDIVLPDLGENFTPNYIKDFYASMYPSLTNAQTEDKGIKGDVHVYEFKTKVGVKG